MEQINTIYKNLVCTWRRIPPILQITIFFVLLTMPIIAYCLPLLLTGNKIAVGDADYYMQLQEAARISIFKYGQFPWWNPWVSGGIPLYANPQFGLFSLTTIFTLTFGSIIGYKLALLFYLIIGFWGLFLLFTKAFKTPLFTAVLLSYIWTFGSLFAYRSHGHYTFFTIQFFPYILLLFLNRRKIKYSWLWLGLVLGLMINTAAHYTTIMSLVVFGIFVLIEIVRLSANFIKQKALSLTVNIDLDKIKFLLMSSAVTILVAGQRLYYSLEYFHEYPRSLPSSESTMGIVKAIIAIFGPVRQYIDTPSIPNWSWMEASAYIGISTGIVAILCLVLCVRQKNLFKARVGKISPTSILVMGTIFFVLGLGSFVGIFSPYNILHLLPVFSGMRVACRWLLWTSLMVIFFIALYNQSRCRKIINGLLLVSVIELFIFGSNVMPRPYAFEYESYPSSSIINQQILYDTKRWGVFYDGNFTATTMSNIGQVVAGDSLVYTLQGPPAGINTIRCDSDNVGCNFVMTNNAKVTYWSPNYITLKRTGSGIIKLNMNPGKYWLVNGNYIFYNMRLAEPDKEFSISDSSQTITIKLQPRFSPGWFLWRINKL